jgi:hypothetical protein
MKNRKSFRVSISDKKLWQQIEKERAATQHTFSAIGRDALIFYFNAKRGGQK